MHTIHSCGPCECAAGFAGRNYRATGIIRDRDAKTITHQARKVVFGVAWRGWIIIGSGSTACMLRCVCSQALLLNRIPELWCYRMGWTTYEPESRSYHLLVIGKSTYSASASITGASTSKLHTHTHTRARKKDTLKGVVKSSEAEDNGWLRVKEHKFSGKICIKFY